MKQLLLSTLIFLFLSTIVNAQTGIKFGLKAGYSYGTQYGTIIPDVPFDVDSDGRKGFTGGILLYFPITESFGVQQEFIYTEKGSKQHIMGTNPEMPTDIRSSYKLNYFELPILFKYHFLQIGDFSIYGSSGFSLSTMLNTSSFSVDGYTTIELENGPVEFPFSESGNMDGLDKFDYSFVYGLGIQYKIFEKNCFFDYRQTIGWNTLMMPTLDPEMPAPLRNQTYSFCLGLIF